MAEGISYTSVMNKQMGGSPIYCAPGSFKLSGDSLKRMITSELTGKNAAAMTDATPIGVVVVHTLKTQYPCK